MNIILIGFMGVGKGQIARAYSKKSGIYAIDTDDLIESLENRKIKKIFKKEGELYFRELEKKTALWLEKSVDNSIISTGGGFYKQPNIKRIGKVIYLESSFEAILEKIKNSPNAKKKIKKRPLLKNEEEAKRLFNIRVEEYQRVADIKINVENRDVASIVEEIIRELNG